MENSSQPKYVTKISCTSLVLGILFSISCVTQPQQRRLEDELFYSEEDERIGVQWFCSFEAPIILSGEIVNVTYSVMQGIKGPHNYPIAKVHMSVDGGTVLKGTIRCQRCSIAGYILLTNGVQPRKWNPPVADFKKGQKRLFFLREVNGGLRLARDLYDHTLPLYGGIRLDMKYNHLDARTKAVALLLRPPLGEDYHRWSKELPILFGQAAQIIGPWALHAFIRSEALGEVGSSAVKAALRQEIAAFRTYYPEVATRAYKQQEQCPDFGQR